MDESFPPESRLHNGRDYGRVFKRQQKAAGRHLVVLLSPRQKQATTGRIGIMVSTKVSKLAVRRHQLKRWVRELFRTRLKTTLVGYDAVVLFRSDPPPDGHGLVDAEIVALIPRALAAAKGPSGHGRRPSAQPARGGEQ